VLSDPAGDVKPPRGPASGDHERHLATSTIALQISQAVAVLSMLGAITVIARHLTLAEFGTYGLLVSLTTYVVFAQGSVEAAAVKALAEADDQHERDSAFSTAVTLYVLAGVAAGGLIAALGELLLPVFDIPRELRHQAEISVPLVAIATCLGWPLLVYRDALRASQRFVDAAKAEGGAYLALGGLMAGLGYINAPLWALASAGASIGLAVGLASACVAVVTRLPFRYRRSALNLADTREFLGISSYLLAVGIADLVIYALDRTILAAFRPVSTVGLYEGPVRAHNLIRQIAGALTIPVLPTAARYLAERDVERTRALLLRGTRYTLAAIVPMTVVFMVLARPILEVWLGARYGVAATAMTLLVSYWLVGANTGVAWGVLLAAGRIRALTAYAVAVAALNLGLSLALTPSLGLNGVVLGTTLSYLVGLPFFLGLTLRTVPVSLGELARIAWLPAYATAAGMGAALVAARLWLPLDTFLSVAAVGLAALAIYFVAYYVCWLTPGERLLLRDLVGGGRRTPS
jgi:O-antigen/teichoic acid export membrane protein